MPVRVNVVCYKINSLYSRVLELPKQKYKSINPPKSSDKYNPLNITKLKEKDTNVITIDSDNDDFYSVYFISPTYSHKFTAYYYY